MSETPEHPAPERYWRHLRRISYTAMAALLVILLASIFGRVREAQIPLIEGLAWVFGVIVLAYYGNDIVAAARKPK